MRRPLFLIMSALLALATVAAHAGDLGSLKDRLQTPQAKIVNGVFESNYPAVGALLFGTNPDNASTYCSGTLIGCETFLTAGHCVEGNTAADYIVFLPNAGFFSVASIALHPSYEFPQTDVAVMKLGALVNGVAPMPLNTTGTPAAGSAGTIVGFGRSGGNEYDYGLKRSGNVSTVACPATSFYSGSVCWRFAAPLGPPGSNADTCNADSGGPLFVDFGSGDVLAGLTSGGTSTNCNPVDFSYDLNVFQFLSFIQSEGGADLNNTSCGSLPQVGEALTKVQSATGSLSSGSPSQLTSFDIPSGTTTLRVAMTGSEDYGSDFDLYLRHGSAPTTSVYDCRDIGSNQYGYCEIAAPASGTWYVLAQRAAGVGAYQLTITSFGRDCALPASAGLACDDGNACTSGDVCAAGVCAGAAVSDGTGCDDGNDCTTPDSCQAGVCGGAAVADGTPCDDGDPCSRPDVCTAGSCAGSAPASSCRTPFVAGRSFLQLKDRTPNSFDRLAWKWVRGQATTKADFGDPTATTDYWLCAYDRSANVPSRILQQKIPAGSKWTEMTAGYRFRDPALGTSGIYYALLREGADGSAKILVKGKAHPLEMPPLGLDQDPSVTVQLLNDTGCWEAGYSSNVRNDAAQFKARD